MSSQVLKADEATFTARVIERSREVPVLVDFWAEWCGPCRMLGPVLEAIAASEVGRVEIVKVNTDESPDLAARYRIQGIPAVKLFIDGEVAAEFAGAQPEAAVRRFLDQHIPSATDRDVRAAEAALADGDRDAAQSHLASALSAEPGHERALLLSARLALESGDLDAARQAASAVPSTSEHGERAAALVAVIEMAASCGDSEGSDAARKRAQEEPDDPAARLALGRCLAAEGKYEEALSELLASVAADKRHEGGAAAREMVALFHLLGPQNETVREMRRQLTIYS